jgi:hypothetical protein
VDVRITHTMAYLLWCPWLLVPEAMRACKFTLDESASRSKQMAIRRSFAKSTAGKLVPPPDVIDAATAAMTTVSPLTNQTSAVRGPPSTPTMPRTPTTQRMSPRTPTTPGGMRTTRPKPKQKLIRKLAGGMQKFQINKLAALDHAKSAFKRATRWYAQEKDKTGGLLLLQIEKKAKKEYDGVGPCHTTIRRYVIANIAGMSPLKHGVKGDVPPCAFGTANG